MEGCLKPKQLADLKDNEHGMKTEFDLQTLWSKQLLCTATGSSVTLMSPTTGVCFDTERHAILRKAGHLQVAPGVS